MIPGTAVVDFRSIAEQLATDIRDSGAEVIFGHPVMQIDVRPSEVHIATESDERAFDHLIVCAGLQSSLLARLVCAAADPEIIPFGASTTRSLRSIQTSSALWCIRFRILAFPFSDVHFTRGLNGHVHIGPNTILATSQEGYRWSDVRLRDLSRTLMYPGMRRMARQHWRMGAQEVLGPASKSIFLRRAHAYVPDLVRSDLVRSGAGVRAQALTRDGALVDDFVIDHRPRVTLVRNAPSPAASACWPLRNTSWLR